MRTRRDMLAAIVAAAVAVAGCATRGQPAGSGGDAAGRVGPDGVREYRLVAEEIQHELRPGVRVKAWAFNGRVPGPELRLRQGERVRVVVENRLPEPISIHWHGLPVPNAADGVPGVTQNAVKPGATYTYEFVAPASGTYWYHSHQRSVEQIDRGLYGALIVEPAEGEAARPDREFVLILDEWMSRPGAGGGMPGGGTMPGGHGGHGGMSGMPGMGGAMPMSPEEMHARYDVFTINGKAGDAIPPLEVRQGERVRVRLINAGYQTHYVHLHGHRVRVTHTDGQPLPGPRELRDVVVAVAPGERYDLAFVADNPGAWWLEAHAPPGEVAARDMRVLVRYAGVKADRDPTPSGGELPVFDPLAAAPGGATAGGGPAAPGPSGAEYTLELGERMDPGKPMGMAFTLNGRAFPDTEPLTVREGQWVKVRLVSRSRFEHPMHLHGMFFRVLSRDGRPVAGEVWKDTLNVRPGEVYEIAFRADNPGRWMLHCHELHHAAAGMATLVVYEGFQPAFAPDPSVGNVPE